MFSLLSAPAPSPARRGARPRSRADICSSPPPAPRRPRAPEPVAAGACRRDGVQLVQQHHARRRRRGGGEDAPRPPPRARPPPPSPARARARQAARRSRTSRRRARRVFPVPGGATAARRCGGRTPRARRAPAARAGAPADSRSDSATFAAAPPARQEALAGGGAADAAGGGGPTDRAPRPPPGHLPRKVSWSASLVTLDAAKLRPRRSGRTSPRRPALRERRAFAAVAAPASPPHRPEPARAFHVKNASGAQQVPGGFRTFSEPRAAASARGAHGAGASSTSCLFEIFEASVDYRRERRACAQRGDPPRTPTPRRGAHSVRPRRAAALGRGAARETHAFRSRSRPSAPPAPFRGLRHRADRLATSSGHTRRVRGVSGGRPSDIAACRASGRRLATRLGVRVRAPSRP